MNISNKSIIMKHEVLTLPNAISSRHSERETTPDHIWDWQSFSSWRDAVWELMADVIDPDVKNAFRLSPPKNVVCDDLEWLDEVIWSVKGEYVDSKELLSHRLRHRFKALRAFHGSRPNNVESYYSQGILPLEPKIFHELAQELFLRGNFPELNHEILEHAIQQVDTVTRKSVVYFEANERDLIDNCGHYMLYGSEYLLGIASCLKGSRDYRQVLKRIGTPTVFTCDVPLTLLSAHTIGEFAGMSLEMIFEDLLYDDYSPAPYRGAGFRIATKLPPSCIVGHYHPKGVCDPLEQRFQ